MTCFVCVEHYSPKTRYKTNLTLSTSAEIQHVSTIDSIGIIEIHSDHRKQCRKGRKVKEKKKMKNTCSRCVTPKACVIRKYNDKGVDV